MKVSVGLVVVLAVVLPFASAAATNVTVSSFGTDERKWESFRKSAAATKRIQNAIDAVWSAGGGVVTVEPGSYPVGGLRLRSGVTLYLKSGAVLFASRKMGDYDIISKDVLEPLPEEEFRGTVWLPPAKRPGGKAWHATCAGSRWNDAIFRAYGARDIAVIGEKGSVIDGCNSYDPQGEEWYRGVHGFSFFYCTNVLFRGYTIQHAGNWNHRLERCLNVTCENVTALGGHDGFHVRSSDDVTIRDCVFHTGDDCIAGHDNVRVRISGCDLSSACSALRFGGFDILVDNCTAWGPCDYVFRGSIPAQAKRDGVWDPVLLPSARRSLATFFLYMSDRTVETRTPPGKILVRNCRVRNAARFLRYNFGGETWQKGCPLSDITFEDCTAEGLDLPLAANGGTTAEGTRPLDLSIRRCSFAFAHPVAEFISASNLKSAVLDDVSVRGTEGAPVVRTWGGEPKLRCEKVTGVGIRVDAGKGTFQCPARRSL